MVKLYRRDNVFSVNKLKKSEAVELMPQVYYGVRLEFDETSENYHVVTIDGDIFRIPPDNMTILLRTSFLSEGRLVGPFMWQTYKNKSMFLQVGALDPKPLLYGDVVEPILPFWNSPSKMIYLGQKHIVDFTASLQKRVKKSQHIFVSLESEDVSRIITMNVIASAFYVVSNDTKLADSLANDLNTNKLSQHNLWMDSYSRPFYMDDYYKTSVIPKLVPSKRVTNKATIRQNKDARKVVCVEGKFYDIKFDALTYHNTFDKTIKGFPIKDMDIFDEPFDCNLNYQFNSKKYINDKEIDIDVSSNYEWYIVAYEVWQDGKFIGRK